MTQKLLSIIGRRATRHTTAKLLSPSKGLKMMRDPQVRASHKLLALGAGILITVGLLAIEFPLEAVVAAIPGLGIALDLFVDGSELLIAPFVIACTLLPRMQAE